MKKIQLLNEIMGIPKAVDFWVDSFSIILAGVAKGLVSKDEIEESEVEYVTPDGEQKVGATYRSRAKMEGKEFMNWVIKMGGYGDLKGLLNDSRFKQFPLYNPTVNLSLYFLPQELYDIEFADREDTDSVEASHTFDTSKKSISIIGNNKIFVNQTFGFQIYLPESELDSFDVDSLRRKIKPTISHELTHSYEAFNRVSNTGDPYQGQETFLNAAVRLMKDDKYPQWGKFLHLIYLHLSFEINARVTQFYYTVRDKDIKNLDQFMVELKKSSVWKEVQMLENFNAENFINSFKVQGVDLFSMIEDIGKQMERRSQGLPAIKPTKTPQEGMKHLIQGWDYVLQMLNQQLIQQGVYKGKLMDLVPQKAMEDPYHFFKFFEKRFHKKAHRFKKKLYNIAALILDRSLMEK